jgi:coatomer subunit beta'
MQEFGVVSYTLLLSLIEYKTAVMREDMEAAAQILPSIPKVCFFLQSHGKSGVSAP